MAQVLADTASGDLTKRLPEVGNDEIAQASRPCNRTREELRKMIIAIKSQAGTLSDIGSDLANNMTQITANIQNIKGRVLNQSASITETNAMMKQVTVNINRLSRQVARGFAV